MGWFDPNESLTYSNINIPSAGTYNISFRVATGNSNAKAILKNSSGTTLCTVNINNSGWSTWQTVSGTATLPAGTQTLRVECGTAGFDFNWWEIATTSGARLADTSNKSNDEELSFEATMKDIFIYPNPLRSGDDLNIGKVVGNYSISIFNTNGKLSYQKEDYSEGSVTIKNLDLPSGFYIVSIISGKDKKYIKFLIQ